MTTLRQLAALIERAAIVVTADSDADAHRGGIQSVAAGGTVWTDESGRGRGRSIEWKMSCGSTCRVRPVTSGECVAMPVRSQVYAGIVGRSRYGSSLN